MERILSISSFVAIALAVSSLAADPLEELLESESRALQTFELYAVELAPHYGQPVEATKGRWFGGALLSKDEQKLLLCYLDPDQNSESLVIWNLKTQDADMAIEDEISEATGSLAQVLWPPQGNNKKVFFAKQTYGGPNNLTCSIYTIDLGTREIRSLGDPFPGTTRIAGLEGNDMIVVPEFCTK